MEQVQQAIQWGMFVIINESLMCPVFAEGQPDGCMAKVLWKSYKIERLTEELWDSHQFCFEGWCSIPVSRWCGNRCRLPKWVDLIIDQPLQEAVHD